MNDKIVPYYPVPFRKPNKCVKTYEKPFDDGFGNTATITYADYMDKKGKLITGFVLYIRWNEDA